LDRLVLQHGAPHNVRFDNGPEFVAYAVHDWCRFNSAGSLFIDLGSPWENAWIEPFNGRLRDELLNSWRFDSLLEARVISKTGAATTTPTDPTPPRRTHPSRVRSTVDHDPPTPSRIATGPLIGSPSLVLRPPSIRHHAHTRRRVSQWRVSVLIRYFDAG
jgi:putative transposase